MPIRAARRFFRAKFLNDFEELSKKANRRMQKNSVQSMIRKVEAALSERIMLKQRNEMMVRFRPMGS